MLSNPRRKQGPAKKAAQAARNLAIADTIYVFLRDRVAGRLPGVKPKRRVLTNPKVLAAGGAAAAAAAGAAVFAKVRRSKSAPEPPPYTPPSTPSV